MAEEVRTHNVTPEDVKQLAGKLESFVETLPEQDRDVLSWIIDRAAQQASSEGDTSGYRSPYASARALNYSSYSSVYGSPYAFSLGRALGFGNRFNEGVSVGVTWEK